MHDDGILMSFGSTRPLNYGFFTFIEGLLEIGLPNACPPSIRHAVEDTG